MQGSTARRSGTRLAFALAALATLALLWLSLGVGIIGRDGDPANRLYLAVLGVALLGSLVARLRPRGMAATLFAMAFVQSAIGVFAAATGMGLPWSGAAEVLLLNAFFVACFGVAGILFLRAGRGSVRKPA